jgi:hypothetical protein
MHTFPMSVRFLILLLALSPWCARAQVLRRSSKTLRRVP